jgi:hypothetical protein
MLSIVPEQIKSYAPSNNKKYSNDLEQTNQYSTSSSSLQVLGLKGLLQSKQRIFTPSLHWAS